MRIRVFFLIVVVCVGLWLGSGALFAWFIIDGGWHDLNIFTWMLMICMVAIPMILLIWCIFTMSNVIEFDETGIRRIRFGRIIRNYSWEKVRTVSCTANDSWTGWVYISEQEKKYDNGFFSIGKMRLDRQVIYFHMSQKAQEALRKYVPPSLKAPWMGEEGK